jgi:hypothetical protein
MIHPFWNRWKMFNKVHWDRLASVIDGIDGHGLGVDEIRDSPEEFRGGNVCGTFGNDEG